MTDNASRTCVRIPNELYSQLKEIADMEDRSINYLIIKAVEKLVRDYK